MKSLAARTLLGFISLVVALATALFGPAWSFHYWQAWIYLLLFAVSSAAITVYLWKWDPALLRRRVTAGPTAEETRDQKIIQSFASLAFLALLIVPSLDHRFSWSHAPLSLVVIGDLLVVLGFFVVFRTFRVNSFTAATVEVTDDQRVISDGPYSVVRHPMYTGALIMLVGTPLALGSPVGVLVVPLILAVIVVRLLAEEEFLLASLRGYPEYVTQVKWRLVPFIW